MAYFAFSSVPVLTPQASGDICVPICPNQCTYTIVYYISPSTATQDGATITDLSTGRTLSNGQSESFTQLCSSPPGMLVQANPSQSFSSWSVSGPVSFCCGYSSSSNPTGVSFDSKGTGTIHAVFSDYAFQYGGRTGTPDSIWTDCAGYTDYLYAQVTGFAGFSKMGVYQEYSFGGNNIVGTSYFKDLFGSCNSYDLQNMDTWVCVYSTSTVSRNGCSSYPNPPLKAVCVPDGVTPSGTSSVPAVLQNNAQNDNVNENTSMQCYTNQTDPQPYNVQIGDWACSYSAAYFGNVGQYPAEISPYCQKVSS